MIWLKTRSRDVKHSLNVTCEQQHKGQMPYWTKICVNFSPLIWIKIQIKNSLDNLLSATTRINLIYLNPENTMSEGGEEQQKGQKWIKTKGRSEKLRQRQKEETLLSFIWTESKLWWEVSDERAGREWLDIHWPWLNPEGERSGPCLLTGCCRAQRGPPLRFNTVGGKHTNAHTHTHICMQGAYVHINLT